MTETPAERVLVTGGTGYVAGWCIVELLRHGYAVRATVRDLAKADAVRAAVGRSGVALDRLTVVAADLVRDDGWDAAVQGCRYVLHVASPLGATAPRDRHALIAPARDGTLRVLRAATAAGVQRVVMTSSCAACAPRLQGADSVNDETVWSDPADPALNAYRLSKIAAERAAWEFMRGAGAPTSFTTILPSAIFGPVLTREHLGSVQIIDALLRGRMPAMPRVGFNVVDVRDVADLHVRAMTAPAAAGERFIAAGDFLWLRDMARTLRAQLGQRAEKVPTREMPNLVTRALSLVAAPLRTITPTLGRKHVYASDKARRLLGFSPRAAETTVIECAESLLA